MEPGKSKIKAQTDLASVGGQFSGPLIGYLCCPGSCLEIQLSEIFFLIASIPFRGFCHQNLIKLKSPDSQSSIGSQLHHSATLGIRSSSDKEMQ